MSNAEYNYMIILVGESGVGKTSLLDRYVYKTYFEYYTPTCK